MEWKYITTLKIRCRHYWKTYIDLVNTNRKTSIGISVILCMLCITLVSIVFPKYLLAGRELPLNEQDAWWQKEIHIENIELPEDRRCAGHVLISALRKAGLPINMETIPIVKGKDIVLGINPEFSQTDRVWIAVPRSTEWALFKSDSQTVSASVLIDYYAQEAGGYRRTTIDGLLVLLPEHGDVLTENVTVDGFSLRNTCLLGLYSKMGKTLKANQIGWGFMHVGSGSHYSEDIKFDFAFPGGTLAELLCEIVHHLEAADPEYLYYWSLGGTSDHRSLGVSRIERRRLEDLQNPRFTIKFGRAHGAES